MADTIERQVRFRDLLGKVSAQSHGALEGTLALINVHILEMEDVLFHHNSAVMMPENPEGKSSADGTDDDAENPNDVAVSQAQAALSGLKALALVFRELGFDERKKIIIAAHTDTSGDVTYNFELSEMRAQNVQYLLTGDKENWTAVSYGKQKVEDYQQVLTWVFKTRRWLCNPSGIDDSWGPNTEHATENFINYYNTQYARPKGLDEFENPAALMRTIRNDGKKRWPEELWGAVFELYSEDMAKALSMPRAQFDELRETVGASPGGKFLYETKPYVACGESFPIDNAEKSNYRSQSNRRVEILFFDETEALAEEDFICPAVRNRTHTPEECPLWNGWHFLPLYIDPNDLNAVAYHLKFQYYDRVLGAAADVPAGLNLRAFVGANEITSRQSYSNGTYTVVVQFPTNAQAQSDANKVRFEFRTADQWIFTENDAATPTLVTRTPQQIAALTPVERWKYYDLPAEWSSLNWRCTVSDQINDFVEHMKTRTSANAPIIINLDDIVLTAANGSQIITDKAGTADGKDATGNFPALSVTDTPAANPPQYASRVRILFVDSADNRLKVHYPTSSGTDEAQHTSSLIRFQANAAGNAVNFIKNPPGGARVVVFCHEFYDVTAKRAVHTDAAFDPARGHVLGARRAVLDDRDVHYKKVIVQTDTTPLVHNPIIGDFDVHYLHGGGCDGTNLISFIVVYWCGYVTLDTNPTNGPAGGNTEAPTDAEINKFHSTGMMNCIKHWNKKEYEFIDNAGAAAQVIRPFFFFEGNEAFKLTPPNPAVNFALRVQGGNLVSPAQSSAEFTTALQNARGGKPKSVVFITEEGKGSWMQSFRSANVPFTMMSLRMKTCQDDPGRFPAANLPSGAGFPFAEFSDPGNYGVLAMAHEIGHATGQVDDYTEDLRHGGRTYSGPSFSQFGMLANGSWLKDNNGNHTNVNFHQRVQSSDAYVPKHDDKTMMDKNGPIRMRHVWRFARWLSEGGPSAGSPDKPLQGFLNDVQFKVHAPNPSPALEYFRANTDPVNPWACSTSARLTVLAGPPLRTMNAYLWRALDETRRGKRATGASAGQDVDFKAILVVRPLLSVSFIDAGANVWTPADMSDWLSVFNGYFTKVQNLLHDKFMLSGSGDLDPTLIHFLPGFDIYPAGGAPTHNHFNYRVEVHWDNTAFSRAGDILTLGYSNALLRELFNYLYNKPAASAAFAAADFAWIRTWFSGAGVANAAFNVVEV